MMTFKLMHGIFIIAGGLTFGLSACSASKTETESMATHAEHSRMGSHGMAVIGQTDILFVHMPLYRRPHDRQILTPARFNAADEQARFSEWRASYKGLISIVPKNFDLNRLDPDTTDPLTTFSADIYEGHFERGGMVKFESVTFDLKTPLLHLPVTDEIRSKETFTYVEHGNDAYLVRHIGARPSKDEILKVTPINILTSGEMLTTDKRGAMNSNWLMKRQDETSVSVTPEDIAYLETQDFALPK